MLRTWPKCQDDVFCSANSTMHGPPNSLRYDRTPTPSFAVLIVPVVLVQPNLEESPGRVSGLRAGQVDAIVQVVGPATTVSSSLFAGVVGCSSGSGMFRRWQ